MSQRSYGTRPMREVDPSSGFRSGTRPLDDYFQRHALPNDRADVGRTYVLDAPVEDLAEGLP